jgi:hypothetical protein
MIAVDKQEAAVRSSENPVTETERVADEVASEPREIGGPQGPEPTRFGDWERAGRCIDF